jgi:hypothetical protein
VRWSKSSLPAAANAAAAADDTSWLRQSSRTTGGDAIRERCLQIDGLAFLRRQTL